MWLRQTGLIKKTLRDQTAEAGDSICLDSGSRVNYGMKEPLRRKTC